jgi:transposase
MPRSGLHVYVILNDVNLENWRDKVIFVHDRASAYNSFNWFTKHEVEKFGKRSLVVFRRVKHRLAWIFTSRGTR